jgi:hypothetical protein
MALLPDRKLQWHRPRKKFEGFWSAFYCQHSQTCSPFKDSDSFINDAISFLNLVVPVADKVPVSLDGLLSLQGKMQKDLPALINTKFIHPNDCSFQYEAMKPCVF